MKKILTLIVLTTILTCCSKKICLKTEIDKRSFYEYKTVKDTCKNVVTVFENNTVHSKGFGDRLFKQDKWSFYKDDLVVSTGSYLNSQPTGEWSYLDYKVNWEIIEKYKLMFIVSLPDDFELIVNNENQVLYASTESSKLNFKCGISIIELNDLSLKSILEHQSVEELKIPDMIKSEYRIIPVDNKKEYAEKVNEYNFQGKTYYAYQNVFVSNKNNKIYSFSVNYEVVNNLTAKIIGQQILESFKLNDDLW